MRTWPPVNQEVGLRLAQSLSTLIWDFRRQNCEKVASVVCKPPRLWCCIRTVVLDGDKGPTLGRGVDSREAVGVQGGGGMWELSVLSNQFCCGPETTLKNKILIKKKGGGQEAE